MAKRRQRTALSKREAKSLVKMVQRKRSPVTQKEAADFFGVSLSTVGRVLRGDYGALR